MKKLLAIFCLIGLAGCAQLQSFFSDVQESIEQDAPIVLKDVSSFWSALNAVNSVVGQNVTSQQLISIAETFGASPTAAATVAKDIGAGESAITVTAGTAQSLSAGLSAIVTPTANAGK